MVCYPTFAAEPEAAVAAAVVAAVGTAAHSYSNADFAHVADVADNTNFGQQIHLGGYFCRM